MIEIVVIIAIIILGIIWGVGICALFAFGVGPKMMRGDPCTLGEALRDIGKCMIWPVLVLLTLWEQKR